MTARPVIKRSSQTETLLAVAEMIGSTLDPVECLRLVAREVCRALGADSASAYSVDPAQQSLLPVAGYRVPKHLLDSFRSTPLPLNEHPFLEEAWKGGRVVWSSDSRTDPRIDRDLLGRFPARSGLFIPVMAKGKLDGGFWAVWWDRERPFETAELELAEAIGRQAGIAVRSARLFQESERRRQIAERLASVARLIVESLEPGDVGERIVRMLLELLGVASSALYRVDPRSGDLSSVACAGAPWAPDGRLVLPRGTGLCGLAVREQGPVVTANVLDDPRIVLTPAHRARIEATSLRSGLAVPLLTPEGVTGALVARDGPGRRFDFEEIELARAFASHAALALQKADLLHEARCRVKELESLHGLVSEISSLTDVAEICDRVTRGVAELVGARRSLIAFYDRERGELVAQEPGHGMSEHFIAGVAGEVGQAAARFGSLRRTGSLVANSLEGLPQVIREFAEREGLQSIAALSLLTEGAGIGVLYAFDKPGGFGDTDVRLLEVVASHGAQAIHNSRLYTEVCQARDFLESIARNSADAIVTTDPGGRITFFSNGAEEMFGYRAEEVVGRGIAEFTRGGLEEEQALRARLVADGRITGYESGVLSRDGGWVETEMSISLLRDTKGSTAGALAIFRDLTERRRVQRRQATLSAVSRALAEAATLSEGAERVLEAICAGTGWELGEIWTLDAGKQALRRAGGWHAPGLDAAEFEAIGRETILRPGAAPIGQVCASGEPVWVEDIVSEPTFKRQAAAARLGLKAAFASPVHGAGGVAAVMAFFRRGGCSPDDDLSEIMKDGGVLIGHFIERRQGEAALRASEEQFRTLAEGSIQGLYIATGPDNILQYVNAAAARIFGYESPAALIGRESRILRAAHEATRMAEFARARWAGEPVPERYEFQGARKDGTLIWVDILISEVRWGGDRAFLATLFDVTERKALEAQLRQSQKMEAVGQLAGGIAHDFNNLLTVIGGRSRTALSRLGAQDPVRRDLELIDKTAERAAALTRQLLAFSRRQVLQPKVLELNSVVLGMGGMLRRLIGEDIHLVISPGSVGRVKADPGQLEQVIVNLAVNARDAMGSGGRLTIETQDVELSAEFAALHPGAQPGPHVMMEVTDTGIGMDEATQERIFEPFFSTKEVGKGTGLGLSTAYGIVKQHEGYIDVESAPGAGATFRIYLPRLAAPAGTAEGDDPVAESPRGSETILLVEDDAEVRDLAREILEDRGYVVHVAPHPLVALSVAALHREPLHLLVTDVVMPGMSGRQLAEQIARGHPETKVLYVSGYTDEALGPRGVLEPGLALLLKPFTPDGLARKAREVLDR